MSSSFAVRVCRSIWHSGPGVGMDLTYRDESPYRRFTRGARHITGLRGLLAGGMFESLGVL